MCSGVYVAYTENAQRRQRFDSFRVATKNGRNAWKHSAVPHMCALSGCVGVCVCVLFIIMSIRFNINSSDRPKTPMVITT